MLKPGEKLQGTVNGRVTIEEHLGVGGQGAVYRARTEDGHAVAVKWYLAASQRDDLRKSIGELVGSGAPSDHFLWPDDIVTRGDEFGYVMQLRPPDFANVSQLLARRVNVAFPEMIRAAGEIVAAFKALHSKGLYYCDISDGNLFVDPGSGNILICDNDNVGSARTVPTVLGTPRYMAPEIVRGEASPGATTDLFSMAVLLFLLLLNDHPLQGAAEFRIRCFDAAAMGQLYGSHPVFIFDPADDSNRPVPAVHVNAPVFWGIYPEVLRKVFTKAFTEGLHDPGRRPTFREWQRALAAVEDAMVTCACGKRNFYDPTAGQLVCWRCQQTLAPPQRLVLDGGKRVIVLARHTKLYERHLTRLGDSGSRGEVRAEVVKHPTKDLWGLQNLGPTPWFAQVAGGQARSVDPGQSAALRPGTTIQFGEVLAVVES